MLHSWNILVISTVSNFNLIDKENPQQWEESNTDVDEVYISGIYPGDFFHSVDDIITPESTATLMLHSVFGSVLKETDIVRNDSTIFGRYARSLVSRMEKGQDTGLAHHDVFSMWNTLSKSEKNKTSTSLIDSCDRLESFPPVGNFNVAYAMQEGSIDAGDFYIPVVIPAVVSVRSGLAVVVPSINGACYYHSAFNHLAYPYGNDIVQVHVWDILNKKVAKVDGDDFSNHLHQSKIELLKS